MPTSIKILLASALLMLGGLAVKAAAPVGVQKTVVTTRATTAFHVVVAVAVSKHQPDLSQQVVISIQSWPDKATHDAVPRPAASDYTQLVLNTTPSCAPFLVLPQGKTITDVAYEALLADPRFSGGVLR